MLILMMMIYGSNGCCAKIAALVRLKPPDSCRTPAEVSAEPITDALPSLCWSCCVSLGCATGEGASRLRLSWKPSPSARFEKVRLGELAGRH